MTPAEKFVEALQNDIDTMYDQRLDLWITLFAQEWNISEQTVYAYMPVRKRVYPSKEEVNRLIAEWKTDQEIRKMYKLTVTQLKALVIKERRAKLTLDQRKEIKESKESNSVLAKKYKVTLHTIEQVKGYITKINVERTLNIGKWDRSEKEPYWKNIWEVHTMWPAKFIQFNTPLWITKEG